MAKPTAQKKSNGNDFGFQLCFAANRFQQNLRPELKADFILNPLFMDSVLVFANATKHTLCA